MKGSPPPGGPREWHWALMDYGAYLKRSGVRNNNRSAHYTKQSKFEGSLRQVRGAILRELHRGSLEIKPTRRRLVGFDRKRVEKALAGLARDGLIVKVRQRREPEAHQPWVEIGPGPKKGSARGGSALGRKWRIA